MRDKKITRDLKLKCLDSMQDFCVKFESNVVFPQFHTTGQDFFLFSATPIFMLSATDFPTRMHYMHPPKLNITQF